MPSHERLGSEAHGRLSSLVTRVLPGLPDLEHRKIVSELAEVVAPLVAGAYEHEIRQLERFIAGRRIEEQRQADRVAVLREALRWYEHHEGHGGRATRALIEARWQPPAEG